jgi:TolB-like protein/Tfp pilus assembly protein PilF
MSQQLPPKSQISHYRIVSKLGAGGMGEVYLAQDTKLDRKVALKILSPEVAADRSRINRFVQEAKAASALNHPNIITIHEIDETDLGHFIATEFIDGETVRECLRKAPLTVSEALNVSTQVAAALAAAHQAGIIHRDIKPENVMVRGDGLVKVLDFGLAKLTTGSGSDPDAATRIQSDTQPGMIMGTVAYMSPEQARGKTLDARTDVWSLGVLLYEMLSRRPPFRGETASDTLANILHHEPDALNIPALPDDLVRIVERMLAKELGARYPSIVNALSDLKSLQRRIELDSELQPTTLRSAEVHTEVIGFATASKPVNETAADSASSRTDEGFWVAVLSFKYVGSNPDLEAMVEGLSEEIVTGLSRFSYLRVIARSSISRFTGVSGDVRSIGKDVGARYVLEGSIRQGGSGIRVSAQLVDTETGAQLWAETYNRDLETSSVFEVQDDLAARIVATVADSYGVLVHSMRDAIRKKNDDDLTPAEWQFQYFAYREQITPSNHVALKSRLERAAKSDNPPSDLWASLAQVYLDEYAFGFPGDDGTSLDRALVAARRAVEMDRANQFAMVALAQTHFFRQDLAAFGPATERAMALNPLNTDALGILGLEIVHTADFAGGTAIVRRAMELNPNHAGWMHFAPLWDHFHKGEYSQALECANRVDVPGLFWPFLVMASACGHLGRRAEAQAAVRDLLALDPQFAAHARSYVGTWHFASGLMDPILEGLRKAGLEITEEASASTSSAARPFASSETRADEGFWVAVLPFKYRGSNVELEALAEGLSEEIVTGLSRFSYLRVISRSSTLGVTGEATDIRSVGKELGARYVMEGSLRQAGSVLRVSVQLVDASSGTHLWAETYDCPFGAEETFAVQDDLVPRIVATAADRHGVLPHSMSEALRNRAVEDLRPYEVLLRGFGYFERVTAAEHAALRAALERAVEQTATSDCWAMLAIMYCDEHRFGFNTLPDSLGRALAAAQRAVEAAVSNSFAYEALAQALFFRKDFDTFRNAAERAIALNPLDGATTAFMGLLIAYAGDWERGCDIAQRAMQLNPHHPGWYWSPAFWNAYRKRDYRGALNTTVKFNMPGLFYHHVNLAMVYGQLGKTEAAKKAVDDLLRLKPDFGSSARNELRKWLDHELVEHAVKGLRKAGLEIADEQGLSTSSSACESAAIAESSPSIAVLPFVNLSSDADNDYFCDGLAEELLNALSKIDELKVAARTSAFSFKGRNANVSEIADALNVSTVLEGSIRKSGNRIRITTQLINASDGYHLWSERYDREMKDIFDVQDEITVAVVEALKVKLLGEEKAAVLKRHTRNPEALELYLQGRFYFSRFTPDDFQKASQSFRQAIAIDPSYASAYAGLADAYTELSFFSFSPNETMSKAREAANKALVLDDTLGEAHNSLAIIKMYFDWDYAGAEQEFKRAITLNPGSALIHQWYGWYLGLMAHFDESLKELKRAQELDPLSATINSGIGIVLHWSRQPDRAIEQFLKVLELHPNYSIAYSFLAEAYEQKRDFVSAIASIEKIEQAPTDPLTLSTLGYVYAKSGDRHRALQIVNDFVKRSNQEYVPAVNIAQIYAGLGDNEQALAWLEKACDERAVWIPFLNVDRKFDPLRSDPRFQELLKKVGFPAVRIQN